MVSDQTRRPSPPSFRPDLTIAGRAVPLVEPVLMGVVNANPDSFSDPDERASLDAQLARAGELVDQGAIVIDVGGQSGITGVPEVEPEVEAARVVPLVKAIVAQHPGVLVSVDTYKPAVVAPSLEAGARIVNDVSGLRYPEVASLVARAGAALVVMHTRAVPKQRLARADLYDDVVADVRQFLAEKVAAAVELGVDPRSVIVDPGPDFSKTPFQTVEVLRHLDACNPDRHPMLLAISRKDFIGAITGTGPRDRLSGTLAAVAAVGTGSGVILRVHDVAEVRRFLTVLAVLRGDSEIAEDLVIDDALRKARPREEPTTLSP